MQKVYRAVSVMVPLDNGYLMVKESGLWCPPGGKIEPTDKTIMSAAMREAKEETGLIVSLEGFIGNYAFTSRNGNQIDCAVFRAARNFIGELKPQEKDIEEVRFFSLDEIRRLNQSDLLRSGKPTIASIRDYQRRGCFPIDEIFNYLS